MLGERLKQAVNQSRLTADEAAKGLGVSVSNLYVLYKKDTFSVDYVKKAASLLDVPVSYFLDDDGEVGRKAPARSLTDGHSLQEIFQEMRSLREQLAVKDRQLDVKDHQINQLLDLLGKPEGASSEPLSPEMMRFEELMRQYKVTAWNMVYGTDVNSYSIIAGGKVGGTLLAYAANPVI